MRELILGREAEVELSMRPKFTIFVIIIIILSSDSQYHILKYFQSGYEYRQQILMGENTRHRVFLEEHLQSFK